jgi:mono/diheme cytochrome c family protein
MPTRPRSPIFARVFLILTVVGLTTPARGGDAPDAPAIDYARDVRPILSDKCFACHGPDEAERKAGLRLDIQESAFATLKSGSRAIVPGDPDASDLIFRVESDDPETRMPPAKSGKSLTPKQVETLRRWVEQGAPYTEHWAFVPPRRPAIPAVRDAAWVANPIDAFILARLEKEGLHPSPPADTATLARRLSLDLVGLPPTPEQIDAVLDDPAPDALDRYVEGLLASPHYGERWGRWWLDAARYADSDGYEKDKPRFVWAYRDYVIRAFNADLPYHQFLTEQIAGDLLPNATQDQRIATGFLRNSMINEEGGIDPEQFRMEAMFDRMDAIGTGVLGLTLRCAQCHTHKYDPISHEDYYRLFAYLNNAHEANIAFYSPEAQRRRDEIFAEIAAIESALKDQAPDWPARLAEWESTVRGNQPAWTVITPAVEDDSTGGERYLPQPDGSFLALGYAPTKHRVHFEITIPPERLGDGIAAFRLELLNDANLPLGGPGRSIHGTGALTEFEVSAAPVSEPGKVEPVKFAAASANVNPPETPLASIYDDKSKKTRVTGPVAFAIDGKDETAWGHDLGPERRNRPFQAVFQPESPIRHDGGTVLHIYLKQNHGGWNSDDNQNHNLGRFRLAITSERDAQADPLPARVRAILEQPPEFQRNAEQTAEVFSYWRTTVLEWAESNARVEALERQLPEPSTQLALTERGSMRTTSVLHRGDFLKPAHAVAPGVPAFLNPVPPGAPPDRRGLALWLTDRGAPTTARALVNRVWQAYFGIGLVETAEDLGSQGAPPSHPELLDWLAVEFMERGWSLKELHRLITSSNTYRQSSMVSRELVARDPYSRLLARGPRFRVEAEVVRDIALAASGLLNPEVGGPSVNPPAPEFLFLPPASYGPKVWRVATGPERYRRALYTFRYRSVPYPALQVFDAPNGDIACARRTRSNTPLQALTTLNEPLFLESARALARLALNAADTDAGRLVYAFRRCTGRAPDAEEQALLLGLLERQTAHYAQPERSPWALAADDPERPPTLPDGVSPARAAAWTAVARVLLNLDETITKE